MNTQNTIKGFKNYRNLMDEYEKKNGGNIETDIPYPARNLQKGETDLYVPNLHPHRRIKSPGNEEPELIELSNRDHGHKTLADCYFKYKGRETGGFHSNAYIINENLAPHLVQRNIYMDHPLLEGTNQLSKAPENPFVFPRDGIKNQMRQNMNDKLRKESANSRLLGNHILELGGIEDTIGS